LRPHYEEILATWQKKLQSAGLNEVEIEALSHLTLDAQSESLEAANFEEFRQELDGQALLMETKGLLEARVIAGLGIYLECCLPYLFAAGSKGREPAAALARLIAG